MKLQAIVLSILIASLQLGAPGAIAQQPSDPHHHADVNKRGDQAMGFSQEKTTHHFILKPDGGVIDVSTKDPADATSRDQIRVHLAHIVKAFAKGDFSLPFFTHAQEPPGVPEMKRSKSDIKYIFEETGNGGRVLIKASNASAVSAIHEFLRFQIKDHQTGDSLELDKR